MSETPPQPPGESPQGNGNEPKPGFVRPPLKAILFWLLIILAVPLGMLLMKLDGDRAVTELTQSELENALVANDRVTELVLIKDAYTVNMVRGKYKPEGSDEEVPFKADVVYTDRLDQLLAQCPKRDVARQSNLVATLIGSLLPILVLVALIYFLFSRQLKAAGRGAMQFGKSRARMISPTQERVTFADVSGITEAKDEMQEVVEYLRDPRRFQRLGGRIPRGVLMVGPPGTGKTLLARAIAGEAEVPFFSISGSDFVEMFVGVGASRVRDMFEEGKRHAPCIIFIDEIDAVGRSRGAGLGGGHDEREQTLNALLVEMDGFETNTGVIVIAATNRPDVLDNALLRPGRFDRQITIDLPDLRGRLGILRLKVKKVRLSEEADLKSIARGTPGFSGADLENLVNEAALMAARQGKESVEHGDLEEARDKVRWGKERRSRKIDERDRRITAFHEAGHALVRVMCKKASPLHKITIIPRGAAYLGAVMHLPEDDRYTQSKSELEAELAVMMAGRVAEQLIFGEVTSGASADIRQSTDVAKKMVCQWGMSEKMGPLSYTSREEHIFLGREIARNEEFSPETARELDMEIRRIIEEAEARATDILTKEIDRLKRLAETVLVEETLDAKQVYEALDLQYTPPAEIVIDEEPEPVVPAPEPAAGQQPPPVPSAADRDAERQARIEAALAQLGDEPSPAPEPGAEDESASTKPETAEDEPAADGEDKGPDKDA
jgi:cell division protease FtsH